MGRVGCALDNSVAESANSTLKMELVYRTMFRTRDEARIALAGYVCKHVQQSDAGNPLVR